MDHQGHGNSEGPRGRIDDYLATMHDMDTFIGLVWYVVMRCGAALACMCVGVWLCRTYLWSTLTPALLLLFPRNCTVAISIPTSPL
jgi:hypothetical protein